MKKTILAMDISLNFPSELFLEIVTSGQYPTHLHMGLDSYFFFPRCYDSFLLSLVQQI